ncbi:MAG: DUF1592 domain-containing protein [Polyangiaceae bacterium]
MRTSTCGGWIAHAVLVLALAACVGEIGEGAPDAEIDAGKPRRDATSRVDVDARSPGENDAAAQDGGATIPPDGSPPPIDGSAPPVPPVDGGSLPDAATPPPSCTAPQRQLRLLTRREYRNTVRDLFQLATPGAPCPPQTFVYDSGGKMPARVHVAGSFNQWAKTAAAGGWAMQLGIDKRWTVTRDLPAGDHSYKFVIDETEWVLDPSNPRQVDDGQGNKNSLLTVSCGGTGDAGAPALPADLTATFPVESHPRKDNLSDLFPFDDASEKQVVSPTHIEEYWLAGRTIVLAMSEQLSKLVPCDPATDADGCAEKFVRQFGLRAFRRPLTDAEATRYKKLVTSGSSFANGVSASVRAFLSSPNFLYRTEGAQIAGGSTGRLSGYEIASALSYLFWGSMPDQALFDAAAAGRLASKAGIELEARRLLGDPRSRQAVGSFASQWLGAEEILVADKDASLFPEINTSLRGAMVEETQRFVTGVVFDSTRRYDELLRADYTFVNPGLAALYGVTAPAGAWQKQKYTDSYRAGLLAHASVLGAYARSDQTSPIKRGLFVRRRLLCQDLPPPPADVPPVPAVDQTATTRERFRQHTSVAGCAVCHKFIDGIGFGFERFDAIGRLRDTDNGHPIDSSGNMNDVEGLNTNTPGDYNDIRGLADVLVASLAAKNCMATQYYRFSRGAFENDQSVCALGQIQSRFRDSGYDIQEMMIAITQTEDFVTRR